MGRLSKSKGISEKTAPQPQVRDVRGTQDTRNRSTNKSTNK